MSLGATTCIDLLHTPNPHTENNSPSPADPGMFQPPKTAQVRRQC